MQMKHDGVPLGQWSFRQAAMCSTALHSHWPMPGTTCEREPLWTIWARRFPKTQSCSSTTCRHSAQGHAVNRGNAAEALESLRAAAPYELGRVPPGAYVWLALYPVYVRGEAYLAAHQGSEAAAEFEKILDHRGIVINEPIGALAHLQLGRAYAIVGNTSKAKAAYQDFLTLWKDADPDIPVLKQAKAEYAKLQ